MRPFTDAEVDAALESVPAMLNALAHYGNKQIIWEWEGVNAQVGHWDTRDQMMWEQEGMNIRVSQWNTRGQMVKAFFLHPEEQEQLLEAVRKAFNNPLPGATGFRGSKHPEDIFIVLYVLLGFYEEKIR